MLIIFVSTRPIQFENILVGFKKLSLKHFRIIQFLSRPVHKSGFIPRMKGTFWKKTYLLSC